MGTNKVLFESICSLLKQYSVKTDYNINVFKISDNSEFHYLNNHKLYTCIYIQNHISQAIGMYDKYNKELSVYIENESQLEHFFKLINNRIICLKKEELEK